MSARRAKSIAHRLSDGTHSAATDAPEPSATQVSSDAEATTSVVGSVDERGMTPLMRSASEGAAGRVRALLDAGADMNVRREDGFNALSLAAFFGHAQVVWELLEKGADLSTSGRCNASPEAWADSRGFDDVGDILREARAARHADASPRTNVIDEPARFPASGSQEKVQSRNESGAELQSSSLQEADALKSIEAVNLMPRVEEYATETIEEPDVVQTVKLEQPAEQTGVKQPPRAIRALPEIQDPLPVVAPAFHPASAFVVRMTSSRKTLGALVLGVVLVCSAVAALLLPQVRKALLHPGTARIESPTNPPNAAVVSDPNLTVEHPTDATSTATAAPVSTGSQETKADSASLDSPPTSQAASISDKDSASNIVSRPPESRLHLNQNAARSVSRTSAPARKPRDDSAVSVKQPSDSVELPKPAPLSVESRPRVVTTPARNANEGSGSGSASSSVISSKPRSKVIHWP